MTETVYRVKSGSAYLVRFHEDGSQVAERPKTETDPGRPGKPGKPNLAYQPVFSRNIADALTFTDSEEAGAAAMLVQQHGKEASLDPEPPKAEPAVESMPEPAEHVETPTEEHPA